MGHRDVGAAIVDGDGDETVLFEIAHDIRGAQLIEVAQAELSGHRQHVERGASVDRHAGQM
jgi:hypothetical protein